MRDRASVEAILASVLPALALPLLVVLAGHAPTSDELDARVHVHGAECPGAVLAERVRTQLGDATVESIVDVDGTLRQRDDGQWELELAIVRGDDEPSVRSFVAPHCEIAIDAAALVVAIAIDPSRGGAPTTVPEAPEAGEPEPATAERVAADRDAKPAEANTERTSAPPPTVPRARKRKAHGLVRAGGGVDGGALPRAAAFFEIAAGARGRGWRVEATGVFRLQSDARAQRDRDVGGHFSLWAVGARACGVPAKRVFELPLCAAIEGGQLVAQGFGFAGARTTRRPWSAVTLGPGFAWVVRPNIALVVQAALGVPLVRSTIRVENLEVVHETGRVFGRGWIGFEGRFP